MMVCFHFPCVFSINMSLNGWFQRFYWPRWWSAHVVHFFQPNKDCHNQGVTHPKKKKKTARAWKTANSPHILVTVMVKSFMALLAVACWDSKTYGVPGWVYEVANKLKQNPLIFQDKLLTSIVGQLSNLQSLSLRVSFLTMVNNIQVVAKCRRWVWVHIVIISAWDLTKFTQPTTIKRLPRLESSIQ